MKPVTIDDLSTSASFVLGWLAQAESSAFGECKGPALDELVARQLAEISAPGPLRIDPDYCRVRLTEAGIELASRIADGNIP